MNEHRIHKIFQISVLLKGVHGIVECVSGLALALISVGTIVKLIGSFTLGELAEDPSDFVATHLFNFAQNFSGGTKHFYALYLLSHGVVKLLLVMGLLRRQLWSYPVSLAVLGIFIVYQLYRFTYTHGLGMIILTVFDLIVAVLIWHEYQLLRRHLPVD
jgi:uncharacterized membrane protein